jgi:hypothetical protein
MESYQHTAGEIPNRFAADLIHERGIEGARVVAQAQAKLAAPLA